MYPFSLHDILHGIQTIQPLASQGRNQRVATKTCLPSTPLLGRDITVVHPRRTVFVWCSVILPDKSGSYHADMKVRETSPQRCQVVDVEVVTVALKQGKSAHDDLMERLFNPTLNRKIAAVCAVRQMCASESYNAEQMRVRVCICVHELSSVPLTQDPARNEQI